MRWPFRPRPVIAAERLQSLGASGSDIRTFQLILRKKGQRYGVTVGITGTYDEQTREAVQLFQQRALNILDADGYVGPYTARRLRIRVVCEKTAEDVADEVAGDGD